MGPDFELIFRIALYAQTTVSIVNTFHAQFDANAILVFFGFLGVSIGSKVHLTEYLAFSVLAILCDVIRFAVWWSHWGHGSVPKDSMADFFKFMAIAGLIVKVGGSGTAAGYFVCSPLDTRVL
eukprot:TRINITY_DN3099_c0_g1_i1.p2 TRINITY_DN3099_c0_g1~~TRINITY_DN3099_c0_g1_i1.p2  ORF type:complete len:142 (+),score=26.11 TRINITY_DN3099_c0_g1_i1:59-427(+)